MNYNESTMSDDKRAQIKALLNEATANLEKARVLSAGHTSYNDVFYFEALGYGAGAQLTDGEWIPSSQSC